MPVYMLIWEELVVEEMTWSPLLIHSSFSSVEGYRGKDIRFSNLKYHTISLMHSMFLIILCIFRERIRAFLSAKRR